MPEGRSPLNGQAAVRGMTVAVGCRGRCAKLASAEAQLGRLLGVPGRSGAVLSDEPALTQGIIQRQAKSLGRTALHGMPSEAVAALTQVPRADRADVVRELQATDNTGSRALAQVARATQDPVLLDAFRRAGVRP